MLKLARKMDEDTQVKCYMAGWIAVDENCGTLDNDSNPVRMFRSNGRRRSGRPTKYYLRGLGTVNAIQIEAFTDEEAVQIANENYISGGITNA